MARNTQQWLNYIPEQDYTDKYSVCSTVSLSMPMCPNMFFFFILLSAGPLGCCCGRLWPWGGTHTLASPLNGSSTSSRWATGWRDLKIAQRRCKLHNDMLTQLSHCTNTVLTQHWHCCYAPVTALMHRVLTQPLCTDADTALMHCAYTVLTQPLSSPTDNTWDNVHKKQASHPPHAAPIHSHLAMILL